MTKYTDFSVCTENALKFCCMAFQTDLNPIQKDALLDEYTVLPIFPEVNTGLHSLKESGHKLFAFSNGSKEAISKL